MRKIKLFEHLPSPEKIAESFLNEFVELLEQYEYERKEFFDTKFMETVKLIFQHTKESGVIDNEEMLYFPENYSFSEDDFHMVFEIILIYATEKELFTFEEDSFPAYKVKVEYNNDVYLFTEMSGQGTVQFVSYLGKISENKPDFSLKSVKKC